MENKKYEPGKLPDDFKYIDYTREIICCAMEVGTRWADFLVEELIRVELKATSKLAPAHFAQAINYLEAYNSAAG
jgi:GxxExxY protein